MFDEKPGYEACGQTASPGPKISMRSFGKGWRQSFAKQSLPDAIKPFDS